MQFMRLKDGHAQRGPVETYENFDPRLALIKLLDVIQRLATDGPDLTALRVIHEVNKWEVVGKDADEAYEALNS